MKIHRMETGNPSGTIKARRVPEKAIPRWFNRERFSVCLHPLDSFSSVLKEACPEALLPLARSEKKAYDAAPMRHLRTVLKIILPRRGGIGIIFIAALAFLCLRSTPAVPEHLPFEAADATADLSDLWPRVPAEEEALSRLIGSGEACLPPENMRILIWNMAKGTDQTCRLDFARLAAQSTLTLLQEGAVCPETLPVFDHLPNREWWIAKSFTQMGIATGVMTGSAAKPLQVGFIRTTVREPILNTPKMVLHSTFCLNGREEKLLVVNVHAINFVGINAFRQQMDQIEAVLKDHRGPLLLAGDFNAWTSARVEAIRTMTERNGLRQVFFPQGQSSAFWDYAFTRGIQVRDMRVLEAVTSSDHQPIILEASILPAHTIPKEDHRP